MPKDTKGTLSDRERKAVQYLKIMEEHRGRATDFALGDDIGEEAFISFLIMNVCGNLLDMMDHPEEEKH